MSVRPSSFMSASSSLLVYSEVVPIVSAVTSCHAPLNAGVGVGCWAVETGVDVGGTVSDAVALAIGAEDGLSVVTAEAVTGALLGLGVDGPPHAAQRIATSATDQTRLTRNSNRQLANGGLRTVSVPSRGGESADLAECQPDVVGAGRSTKRDVQPEHDPADSVDGQSGHDRGCRAARCRDGDAKDVHDR